MKKVMIVLMLTVSVALFAQPQGPTGKWDLVFEDNFNGTSLDTKKWSYAYTWGRTHNHRAYMVDSMVRVVNGQLRIKAKKERNPSAPDGTDKWYNDFGYIPFDYTSGAINSNSKFNFTYGYLEGSFKAPATLGTWPAFWTVNANGAWPPEIDILEIPHARNQHHFYYHYTNTSGAHASFGTTHTGPDKSVAFHTYGVEWGPTFMKFYFDGQLLNSYTNRAECNQGLNMFIIINLAVGGWAGAIPANAVFPCYYYADWVRAWKRNPSMNLDFEDGALDPWGAWNSATLTTNCKRSGNAGVQLSGNPASIEQTVTLKANTKYSFGGYGRVNTSGERAMFGVKNYGGSQLTKQVSSTSFARDSLVFTTGASNTSAVLFWFKDNGTGTACGDDFFLKELPNVVTSAESELSVVETMCYPNPFTDVFVIQSAGKFHYSLFDAMGHLLEQNTAFETKELGADLKSGVYTVKVSNETMTKALKVVKP
jgi:beta-glucanase (GH16 family)